jgi:hypothetical protein
MMDCKAYRRLLLADPRHRSAEADSHRAGCEACAGFTERLNRFEGRLARAMQLPVAMPGGAADAPARPDNVLPLRPRSGGVSRPGRDDRSRRSRFALAASVLLGAAIAGGLWLGLPRSSLADDVVAHAAHEAFAMHPTGTPAQSEKLKAVLEAAHLRLRPEAGLVSYAETCDFHEHRVPHFVVQTASGPVTALVLVHEKVLREVKFDEQGYRGVILPLPGHGSIAVLTKRGGVDQAAVDKVAARLAASLDWTA